jgi:TRAP-type C4-dicarboxylate transport system permease small subunit
MEIDALTRKRLKLRKKLIFVRDVIMLLVAFFFILVAFIYAMDKSNSIGENMRNIRYGLFSFALIIAGTALIIAVYNSRDKLKKKVPLKKLKENLKTIKVEKKSK